MSYLNTLVRDFAIFMSDWTMTHTNIVIAIMIAGYITYEFIKAE